jgi:two-component system, NtrC family, sensor kinase
MRVLIADDDAILLRLLERLVTAWGHEAVLVSDGNEAWRILEAEDAPKLALLDWMMTGMDGLDIVRKVRERHEACPPYLILMSARDGQEDVVCGLEMGANDYIKKPISRQELRARMEVGMRVLHLQQSLAERVDDLQAEVHERERAEEYLRQSEQRHRLQSSLLEAISNVSPDGILVVGNNGKILSHNRRLFEAWRLDEAEYVGLDSGPLLAAAMARVKDPEQLQRRVEALFADPSAIDHCEIELKDGRTLDRTSTALRGSNGEYLGRVWFFRDITERMKMELDLRHAQKLESVGRLAAGIAHEMNTPIQFVGDNLRFLTDAFADLNGLLGRVQNLAEAPDSHPALAEIGEALRAADLEYLSQEVPQALSQSLGGIARVGTIVQAMKDFAHPPQMHKSPADLNQALTSTLVVARNELKYVAEVKTDFGELPLVECHLNDLNQVFLNLLVNAAHAIADRADRSGQKGTIGVETRQNGDWVRIAISDTGCGIPEDIRDRVFDPFFTTKEVGRGTGQGLAIARSIVVDRHGGNLTFETEVGRGTTFFISLPVCPLPDLRRIGESDDGIGAAGYPVSTTSPLTSSSASSRL